MNTLKSFAFCATLALGLGATLEQMAHADALPYPSRPIKVIIPAGPGDSCDTMLRILGPKVSERLGQSIVIDNHPGSSGQLGLNLIKQAQPDGYTLGCGQGGNMVIVPLTYQKVSYDARKDFTPISLMGSNFLALVVSQNAPFKTTEELIAFARKNPGQVTFGTNGEGAFIHMATEQLAMQGKFKYLHVPYKSMPAVFTEMFGGQIDATFTSFVAVQPLAESGKLKMLAIAREARLPEYPNVPTLSETLPGFTSGGWFGMIAPAGTPAEIVNLLNKEFNAVLATPDVTDRMKKLGLDIHIESPQYFAETLNQDFVKWGKLLNDIHFKKM